MHFWALPYRPSRAPFTHSWDNNRRHYPVALKAMLRPLTLVRSAGTEEAEESKMHVTCKEEDQWQIHHHKQQLKVQGIHKNHWHR